MIWQRDFELETVKVVDSLLIAIILFFAIGLFAKLSIAFLGVGLFIIYLLIFKWYDKRLVHQIGLKNEREIIRLFPGETSSLCIEFENQSMFPIINGELFLKIGNAVDTDERIRVREKQWMEIHFPLTMMRRKKTMINIPITAKTRGISRIKNLQIRFPHLFHFHTTTLRLDRTYKKEVIVYPKLLPVTGLDAVAQMMPGDGRTRHSPFEDVQSLMGIRDYQPTDPFHRVNWKASAKSQHLQTNEYEKVMDRSFVFILNVRSTNAESFRKLGQEVEDLISYTAYLCKEAAKQEIPFELFINVRRPGNVPFIHMPEGAGRSHYAHVLEMLARIPNIAITLSFSEMLHRIGTRFDRQKTIIFIGDIPANTAAILRRWRVPQSSLFYVTSGTKGALLQAWKGGQEHVNRSS
ncbi:DUF58 domain-containing protein [Ornithinibacillus gellani]|uniref:DUF58 domain-containing protein n=1 Tax=Ornithinibacillus gellani TaxID=2293253 RepID=UPI000F4952D6|nr:DUF58 domain-containing protein [Ornithinibacillus gellani]TQS74741.1 DUF58 domain-containing protein [Ornithinibacillus gellani]